MNLHVSTDAAFLHNVWHDPDVLGKVSFGHEMPDAGAVLAMEGTVFLANDHGGFLYTQKEPGVYEVHTQFKRSGRGPDLLGLAEESLRWMFVKTPCVAVLTFVEVDNAPARKLALNAGMREVAEASLYDRKGKMYVLTVKEWVMQTCLP